MKITGGYSGFYKENFIRSSYEYVYCIILEKLKLKYTVEEKIYTLDDNKYKPDFHIYKNNKLIKIVEIKSSKPSEVLKAKNKINKLKEIVDVPVELLQYKDLKKLCLGLNLNINDLINNWKENSIGRNINIRELNPMFSKQHSLKTKQLIGKKAHDRAKNPKYRKKIQDSVLSYYRNGGKAVGAPKKRKFVKCKECSKEFEVIQSSKQQYCSQQCSLISATLIANEKTRERFKESHNKIRQSLFEHFRNKLELLDSSKRNFIYKEVKTVLNKHNIKDIRVFKFIFTKSYNCDFETVYSAFREELNNYLKYMPNLHNGKV